MNQSDTAAKEESVGKNESAMDVGDTNTNMTKQSTGRQLVAIVFLLALATKMFLLPIFLIQTPGRDAYIAMSVFGAFDLLLLVMILIAIKISRSDFFELLSSVIGKVGSKIAVSLVALFLLFKLNICVAEILTFYGTNVFTDFDTSLMIVVLLAFFTAVGTHTLRSLCRLNEILAPILVVCLAVLTVIVIMTAVDLANIFPAVRNGEKFVSGTFHHAAWTGDFTPLVLFIGRTKTKKHTGIYAAASGLIGTATAVFFAIVLSAAFGNVTMLVDSTTNLSSILQYTSGNVYGRLDMFSSILWSISVFMEASLFFYAVCRCITYVIGVNKHFAVSLGVCVAVYVVQVFAFLDLMRFSIIVSSYACSVIVPTAAFAISAAPLVCALINNGKQRRKSTEAKGDAH